jgi:hypothetical protein
MQPHKPQLQQGGLDPGDGAQLQAGVSLGFCSLKSVDARTSTLRNIRGWESLKGLKLTRPSWLPWLLSWR